jgi:hypothetical protein
MVIAALALAGVIVGQWLRHTRTLVRDLTATVPTEESV